MNTNIYSEPFIGKLESVYGGYGVKVGDIGYSAGSHDVDERNNDLGTVCHGLQRNSYQLFQIMKSGSHIARIIPMDKIVVMPDDTGLTAGWEWLDCIDKIMNDHKVAMDKRNLWRQEFEQQLRRERECQYTPTSSNPKN